MKTSYSKMIRLVALQLYILTLLKVHPVKSQSSSCSLETSSCDFIDESKSMQNLTLTLQCCNSTVQSFYREWSRGRQSLSTFLGNLKSWQCPQFEEECRRRTFDYTDFTRLVYLNFCEPVELEKRCYGNLQKVHQKLTGGNASLPWTELIQMNYSNISENHLLEPCVQVAMLDSARKSEVHFHEVIEAFVPFCSFVWCGFDEAALESRHISVWSCMIPECKRNIIIVAVICGILALATTICNATVLAVLFTNKKLLNSQAVYKISLGVADLLVGVVVFPTFISTFTKVLIGRHELGDVHNVSNAAYVDGNTSEIVFKEIREPSGLLCNRISQSYFDAVGFFTTLSLTVSIYTLVAASIDRFIAIHQPLRYQQLRPVSLARRLSVVVWVIAVIFSTLPLYIEELTYRRVTLILVSSSGRLALVLYLLAFILPLITMWFMTIATLCSFKRHSKLRKSLSSTTNAKSKKRKASLEVRLTKTLGIMVGVFTLCILPVGIVLTATLFVPNISIFNPENLNQHLTNEFLSAEVVVTIILTTNSLWNFFIYSGRDTKFRNATKTRYISLLHTLNVYKSGSKGEDTVLTMKYSKNAISNKSTAKI